MLMRDRLLVTFLLSEYPTDCNEVHSHIKTIRIEHLNINVFLLLILK